MGASAMDRPPSPPTSAAPALTMLVVAAAGLALAVTECATTVAQDAPTSATLYPVVSLLYWLAGVLIAVRRPANNPSVFDAWRISAAVAFSLLTLMTAAVLVRRRRALTPLQRSVLGPVYAYGVVALLVISPSPTPCSRCSTSARMSSGSASWSPWPACR
jgi:hypothetical protein